MPSIRRVRRRRRRSAGHVPRVAAEPLPVLLELIVPVPAVVPAVLHITVLPQIIPLVPPENRRKIVIRDMLPRAIVIPGVIPHPVLVEVIDTVIKNNVVRASKGNIKARIRKENKIRPDSDDNFRGTSGAHGDIKICSTGIRRFIACEEGRYACRHQNVFFHSKLHVISVT